MQDYNKKLNKLNLNKTTNVENLALIRRAFKKDELAAIVYNEVVKKREEGERDAFELRGLPYPEELPYHHESKSSSGACSVNFGEIMSSLKLISNVEMKRKSELTENLETALSKRELAFIVANRDRFSFLDDIFKMKF